MIWGLTHKQSAEIKRQKEIEHRKINPTLHWFPWFAWHPVVLNDGRTVWFQRVYRLLVVMAGESIAPDLYYYEYRLEPLWND